MGVKIKKFNPAYLIALVPLISCVLYLLLFMLKVSFSIGAFPVIAPIDGFSLFGLVVLAVAVIGWGFCGRYAARSGISAVKSAIIAHIFPIAGFLAYAVFSVIVLFGGNEALKEAADMFAGLSCGLFSIAGTYLFAIVPLNITEIVLDLALMFGSFFVGYGTGVEK